MSIFASRQCADYARARHMLVLVRRVWHVLCFAVGEASCLVFVVSKPRWPPCRRPRPPSPSPKNAVVRDLSESSVSECVRLCNAHMAYTGT